MSTYVPLLPRFSMCDTAVATGSWHSRLVDRTQWREPVGRLEARRVSTFQPMDQELVTPRLRLRRQRLNDCAAIHGLWLKRDPRSKRLIDADGHPTVDEMRERLAAQLEESDRTGLSLLAIERRDVPGFVGYCGLTVGEATLPEPEIAFELYREVHGQGYATEAAGAVLDAARATGRSRIWASVREWNAPSKHVLARLGFSDSGRRLIDADRGDTLWMTLEL
jgi:ribosomal-protein-alanine N-acetyltransferase